MFTDIFHVKFWPLSQTSIQYRLSISLTIYNTHAFSYTSSTHHYWKYLAVPKPLVLPAIAVCGMMHIDTWPWSYTCWDHMVVTSPASIQMSQNLHLKSDYLTNWPHMAFYLHLWLFDPRNMRRFLHYRNKPSLVYILNPSYNLTSNELWPWCDLWTHHQIRVSNFSSTVVEIHESNAEARVKCWPIFTTTEKQQK